MRGRASNDRDLPALIERLRRERDVGISKADNLMAGGGLRRKSARRPFRQRTAKIGFTIDVSNIAETLENLEDPSAG
jgi:hypothetical protein